MKKRLASLLLTGVLLGSLLPSALAAPAPVEDMAQVLSALDIMTGNENGDLMLSRRVSRAEFTKLVIAASPLGENVGAATNLSPYPDVPSSHWAAPYVEAAVAAGYVNGYLDGTFHPDEEITLAMGVTMAVRLLGYADSDFSGAWPAGQMTLYRNLDLDEGITAGQDSPMTRQDAMYLFYNLLTAKTRQGQTYISVLKPTLPLLNAAGEIDRVALVNSAMEGPVVMEPGWESRVSFDVSTATVYRGGSLSSLQALQQGDVIYYSKSMRTLWAYSTKVTGLYQAVSPNASSPQAVTVAGKTYSIETTTAAYDLTNLGSYKTGDTVTLLLGRDGRVAAVAKAGQAAGTLVGVISQVTDSSYTDQSGNSYTAKTVTLTATDGSVYSYPVEAKSTWKAGQLVQVALASGGEAQVSRLSQSSISGKVNAAGTKLGSTELAEDIQILDMNENGLAQRIYPSRLGGVSLDSDDVKYFRRNASGEIDRLILNDVTGDLYAYGILTSVEETDMSAAGILMGVYEYDVGGVSYTYPTQNSILNLSVGPVRIEGSLMAPTRMARLDSVKLSSLEALTAVTEDSRSFPVSQSVAVYELQGDAYQLSSLERVRVGYTLTGYYDRSVADGGQIRVVIARSR